MITARMTALNENEILMYLGHRGQDVPRDMEIRIARAMEDVRSLATPRLVYARRPLREGAIPGLPDVGADLGDLLAPCREAVLLAVTLGAEVERELARREVTDMRAAVIFDACANAAVENVCDAFEADLREQLEGENLFLTSRFSPGYGDFPIEAQRALCDAVDAGRRIGLAVTPGSMLVPAKSVTAVLGIADTPRPLREKGCEACSLFRTCAYRREGRYCE